MAYERKQNANGDWYYEGNIQKGLVQNLDSEATQNSQPNKDMNAGSGSIKYADPQSPSTNPATRREQYSIEQGNTVPESTKIGAYDTVSPVISTDRGTTSDSDSWNQYTGYIKKISGNSFITTEYDKLRKEIEDSLKAKGIDTTKEVYGDMITDYVNKAIQAEYDMGALSAQMSGLTDTQAYNVKLVDTLTKETWAALAQGKSIPEIAQALGQEEWVIQKIAQGKHAELIQLSQEYEDEQMRKYLRYKEDLDTQMARNVVQYQNAKTNLDYQFNSAIQTLKRNLFDSEWTARGTAAGLGMTGTKYLLDRIETQYTQQMNDLQNTYDYQSANAQIAINNALEDYTTNVKRYMEDYSTAIKEIQSYVYDNYLKLSNQMLSAADQLKALSQIKANVEEMKANAIISAAAALEDGNTTLYNYIKNAYGLTDLGAGTGTMRTERNNNPTAMTTDVAKSLGAREGVDYIQGDSFKTSSGGTLYTAKLLGDPIETTIRIFDNAAEKGIPIFYTKGGKQRWTYIGMSNDEWMALSDEEKRTVINSMLAHEGGNMSAMDYYVQNGGMSTGGISTAAGEYFEGDAGLYQKYLAGKDLGVIKKAVEANASYGNNAEERWNNFISAAHVYQKVMTEENAQTIMDSVKKFQQLKDAWDNIGPEAQKILRTDFGKWVGNFWSSSSIKGLLDSMGIGANDAGAVSHFLALYNNVKAQGFIDTLINSKTQGAAYGQLSDQEGGKITDAWSSLSLKDPINFSDTIQDELIDPLIKKLRSWGYTDEQIVDYIGGKIEIASPTSSTVFTTPGAAYSGSNYTGAQQSGTVNTGAQQMWN